MLLFVHVWASRAARKVDFLFRVVHFFALSRLLLRRVQILLALVYWNYILGQILVVAFAFWLGSTKGHPADGRSYINIYFACTGPWSGSCFPIFLLPLSSFCPLELTSTVPLLITYRCSRMQAISHPYVVSVSFLFLYFILLFSIRLLNRGIVSLSVFLPAYNHSLFKSRTNKLVLTWMFSSHCSVFEPWDLYCICSC